MSDVTIPLSRPVSLSGIVKHFESLPDPRETRNRRHLLVDVIVIAVCGVIVGCQGPTSIERWAKAKEDWLATLLELPNGIPSRDCIRRILSALKPAAFQHCFQNWIAACLLGDADGSHRTNCHRWQDDASFARQGRRSGAAAYRQCLGERTRDRALDSWPRRKSRTKSRRFPS